MQSVHVAIRANLRRGGDLLRALSQLIDKGIVDLLDALRPRFENNDEVAKLLEGIETAELTD